MGRAYKRRYIGLAILEDRKEAEMSDTQKQKILDHLAKKGSITTFEAFAELGITKLTTRISELRKDGYPIRGESVELKNDKGKRIAWYNIYTLDN